MSGSSMRHLLFVCLIATTLVLCGGSQAVWAAGDIQNGGMETFTSGVADNWATYYSGAAPIGWTSDSTYKHGGTYSQKVQLKDTNPKTAYCGLRQTIDASVGDAITFEAWGRTYHNNTNYAELSIGAQWDGTTTPPTIESGQGGTTFFKMTTSGNATAASVTVFLHAKRNGVAGVNNLCWFDDAASYHAYVPPAPTVNNPTASSLEVDVNAGGNSDNTGTQYAITLNGGAYTAGTHWVQMDGSVGTTVIWRTDAEWETETVTGLASGTTYTFQVQARYSSSISQATSLGTGAVGMTGGGCTPEAPTGATAIRSTLCSGGLVTLSAAPGSGGNEVWWYTGSCLSGTQVGAGSGNQEVGPISATTYYARTRNSETGCWGNTCSEVEITTNSLPQPTTASNNGPVCERSTLQLTAGTVQDATYYWTGPNGFNSTDQNPVIENASAAAIGQYVVVVTIDGCTSPEAGTYAIVKHVQTPFVGNNSPVCEGSALNLMTDTVEGATYAWTGPNGFTSVEQNPTIANATAAASGEYNLTVAVAGCTSLAGTTNVLVNPVPAPPTAGSNGPVCQGSTLNLTAGTVEGATYAWTGPNGFVSTQQNPAIESVTAAAAGQYSVTVTVNGCAAQVATATVAINSVPAAPTAAAPSGIGLDTITWNWSVVSGATSYRLWDAPVGGNQIGGAITENHVVEGGLAVGGEHAVFVEAVNDCGASARTLLGPASTLTRYCLENGALEGTYINGVAPEWVKYAYHGTGPNQVYEETERHRSGTAGQRIRATDGAEGNNGGVYQRVGVTGGRNYTISAWIRAWTGTAWVRIGFDPAGGTDPAASTIIWSSRVNQHTPYTEFKVNATVPQTSGVGTVFLYSEGDAVFDDVSVLPMAPTTGGGATTIDFGQSATITASGGWGGTAEELHWYTAPNGGGTHAGTGTSLSVSPTETTTYYPRWEVGANCGSCCVSGDGPGVTIAVILVLVPQGPHAVPFAGVVDGLVETTWSDPDWVIVTSNVILRESICSEPYTCGSLSADPGCPYSPIFGTCGSYNRWWKFAPGRSSGSAFPMQPIGQWTHDSLYVKAGVSFQLYSGSTRANPHGPRMTGPRYVGITFWQSVYVHEPNTYFVAGSTGVLDDYSIELGTDDLLRTDSNNNGQVETTNNPENCASNPNADDCIEDEAGMNKGLLLPVNNNDSDGDNLDDSYDTIINGSGDEADLRDLYVRAPQGVTEGTIKLTVEPSTDADRIRVYNSSGQFILGAGPFDTEGAPAGSNLTETSIPVSALADWTRFRIEGVERKVTRIKATYVDAAGSERGSDIVKIIVFEADSFFPDEPEEAGNQEVSADDPHFPYVTSIDFEDESGQIIPAEDGSSVQYTIVAGSPTLSATSATTTGGLAAVDVTSPTTTGSSFQLSAQVTQVKIGGSTFSIQCPLHKSRLVQVVPGRPDTVQVALDGGANSYPASDKNPMGFSMTARDSSGNVVSDETGMAIDLDGAGQVDTNNTDSHFTGGTAHGALISGFAPENEVLTVMAGEKEIPVNLAAAAINFTFSASASQIPAKSNQYVDITATVVGSDGHAVTDGTEVVWVSSLGSFADGAGTRTGPVAITLVSGGQTTARLYTAPVDGTGSPVTAADRPGTARIMAAIGLSNAKTTIEFTDPCVNSGGQPSPMGPTTTPVRIRLDHYALAGDATTDGVVPIDDITVSSRLEKMVTIGNVLGMEAGNPSSCDLDGDGTVTLVDLIRARNAPDPTPTTAPYYATAQATVTGPPNAVIEVTVSDPTFIEIQGLDANSRITLDASGQAVLGVQSLGVLTASEIHMLTLTARLVVAGPNGPEPASGDPCDELEDRIPVFVAPKLELSYFDNFVAGVIWGGGEGSAAFAGDVIISFFLIGDIRDVGIQMAKLWPGGDDPDALTLAFAGVGIFGSLGGPADVAFTLMKRVAKKLAKIAPNGSGAKVIAKVVKELVQRLDNDVDDFLEAFEEWRVFFQVADKYPGFVEFIARLDERMVASTRRLLAELGESFGGQLAQAAAKVTKGGAKKVIRVIDAVDEATTALLKGKPAVARERLVTGLARCQGTFRAGRWAGAVDDNTLKDLLKFENNQILEGLGYSVDSIIGNLGSIARSGAENVNELAINLRKAVSDYRGNPVQGNLNRINGAVNALRRSKFIAESRTHQLLAVGADPGWKRVQDLDAVAEELSSGKKVIYEFKYGPSHYHPGKKQQKRIRAEIRGRVRLASTSGSPYLGAEIRVQLTNGQWSPKLKNELIAIGAKRNVTVIVEEVP